MQMGYLEGMHKQSIKTCVVHKNFTSQIKVLFLSVSYNEQADAEKVNIFMEEFPIVQRRLLFIQRKDQEFISKFGSQETTPTMPKSSTLFSTIFLLQHMHLTFHHTAFLSGIVLAEQEGAIIHPNSTIIHSRIIHTLYIRESKIKIVMLPPKGHEANPTDLFQAFRQGVRKWQLQVGEPRIMVCKLSEKHKQQCLQFLADYALTLQRFVASTKRELQAAISKTGGRSNQQQDECRKTVSHFSDHDKRNPETRNDDLRKITLQIRLIHKWRTRG